MRVLVIGAGGGFHHLFDTLLREFFKERKGSNHGDHRATKATSKYCKTASHGPRHKCRTEFADIAGFTAWSSMRQPCQVFILLETLYGAFDAIAKRRRIFKIETIGDCYVAVSGVPEPRADHAIAMCKFSSDILTSMRKLIRQLEST